MLGVGVFSGMRVGVVDVRVASALRSSTWYQGVEPFSHATIAATNLLPSSTACAMANVFSDKPCCNNAPVGMDTSMDQSE